MADLGQGLAGAAIVEVDADSGRITCPNPAMALWSAHPRVYLAPATDGIARCPYCGTVYRLRAGGTGARGRH